MIIYQSIIKIEKINFYSSILIIMQKLVVIPYDSVAFDNAILLFNSITNNTDVTIDFNTNLNINDRINNYSDNYDVIIVSKDNYYWLNENKNIDLNMI